MRATQRESNERKKALSDKRVNEILDVVRALQKDLIIAPVTFEFCQLMV